MRSRRLLFLIFSFLILSVTLYSEVIRGRVRDIDDILLEKIDIMLVKGNLVLKKAVTDSNGNFSIDVENINIKNSFLSLISKLYYSMKIPIKNTRKFYKIILIPKEHMREEVTVTALSGKKHSDETPLAESVISKLEMKERIPESIVEALAETPGMDFLGKGGHSITPSIRGLARRRVLMLLNGSRITSDRRVGASASLVSPGLVRRVEIARAASSVIYGSDAMGGVINLFTDYSLSSSPPLLKLHLNGHTSDRGFEGGMVAFKKKGNFSLQTGFSYIDVSDYYAPSGKIFNSGFSTLSGMLSLNYNSEKGKIYLRYFEGYGKNIGKPDRNNDPENFSFNPKIRDRFLQFGYKREIKKNMASVSFESFFNPSEYNLKRIKDAGFINESSFTLSRNYGMRILFEFIPAKKINFSIGADWFGRRGVRIENKKEEDGVIVFNSLPLSKGRRDDTGIFVMGEYMPVKTTTINTGFRYSFLSQSAFSLGERDGNNNRAPVFFLSIKHDINSKLAIFLNSARSFRVSSISEAYYTGLSGRKYVIGNPGLVPERGHSIDLGIKYSSGKIFWGFYLFRYKIEKMIERFRDEEGIYSYDNINAGRIDGAEAEFQFFPGDKVELFGHFFIYRGRSLESNIALNDIPAAKIYIGGKFFVDRSWLEINFIHSFSKSDPGPAEIVNNSYNLVNVKGGVYFSPEVYIHIKIGNLFNSAYFGNADPDIPPAKGFNLSAGITLSLK